MTVWSARRSRWCKGRIKFWRCYY